MLQAYLDDSGMGQPPASVMAGFVSTSERWATFSDEWKQALDMRPSIEYFKMSEAAACSGQFAHWSDERRNERVAYLFSLVENTRRFRLRRRFITKCIKRSFGTVPMTQNF
jgi:hypothetical protein